MDIDPKLLVDEFRYELPELLIAQSPSNERDQSRLMVMNRTSGELHHRIFRDIKDYLIPGDVLVMNDVRVIPARIFARRMSGARIEVFILDGFQTGTDRRALLKPARRIRDGEILQLKNGALMRVLQRDNKEFLIRLEPPETWPEYLDQHGSMPLPPYIKRGDVDPSEGMDRERYQTVFAVQPGAVAAPTAGLHFTPDLIRRLQEMGVIICKLTLWVGWATFRPIETEKVSEHKMDAEYYSLPEVTIQMIRAAKAENRRVIAVGTTTTRALESWATEPVSADRRDKRKAEIFITPGYRFQIIDGLVTNFHLPGSTLIMLVSAFAGRGAVLSAYRTAVENGYRFYSYGDAMLLI